MGSIADIFIMPLIMPVYVPDSNTYKSISYIVYTLEYANLNAGIIASILKIKKHVQIDSRNTCSLAPISSSS